VVRLFPGRFIRRFIAGYTFNKYKEIFDRSGYAILLIDSRTNRFIRVNRAACDLYGYTQAEMRQLTPQALSPQPEDTAKSFEERVNVSAVKPARRKDGTIITVNIQTSFSDKFHVSLVSDVTEEYRIRRALELNEERLKEAQRIGRFGWWEFLPETGSYIGSEEISRIFNDDSSSFSLSYQDNLNFAHPEDRSYLRSSIEEAIEKKKEAYSLHYRIITPKGRIKTIAVNSNVRYDEYGKVIYRYGTCQDVSASQKIMDELIEARRRAEESDKLKTTFLANFSHEIRTPLNAVMGFVNILTSMKTTKEERDEMVKLIDLNSQRLLRLINDMIDLSRIESNNMEIKYTDVEINDFLSSVASSATWELESAGRKDVTLRAVKGETGHRIYQHLDELRLSQIFSNLISNALKFTEKGEIRYGYKVTQTGNRNSITFFVSDTGTGIPVEKQEEIFRPFVQLWSDDMPKVQGAGLGLAICARMTEIMKGRIWVESARGKGSTFWFTFNTPVIIE